MTERPQDATPPGEPRLGPDDLTRDITLPPLPGRPPAVLPRAWAGDPTQAADPAAADPPPPAGIRGPGTEAMPASPTTTAAAGGGPTMTTAAAFDSPTVAVGSPPPGRPYDGPTDELRDRAVSVRHGTVAFSSPGARVVPPVTAGPVVGPTRRRRRGSTGIDRSRRWPWVALTLVPVAVIVVAALLLIWLTQQG